jgi:hypothetical protein
VSQTNPYLSRRDFIISLPQTIDSVHALLSDAGAGNVDQLEPTAADNGQNYSQSP